MKINKIVLCRRIRTPDTRDLGAVLEGLEISKELKIQAKRAIGIPFAVSGDELIFDEVAWNNIGTEIIQEVFEPEVVETKEVTKEKVEPKVEKLAEPKKSVDKQEKVNKVDAKVDEKSL